MKKYFYAILLFVYASTGAFALDYPDGENSKAWHLLELGKLSFEQGDLGEAMVYAGRAFDIHKEHYTEMYRHLYESLKPKQVKMVGDRISDVYSILLEREDKPACAFLDEIFLTHSSEFFGNSISKLMSWLNAKKDSFPEIYYLKGAVFDAEGEFEQAMFFYNHAWEKRSFLEVPDLRFEIIYSMADVSKKMKKFDDREKYLLLVLTEDELYGNTTTESLTLKGMLQSIENNTTTDKFFMLYRHNMGICLKAYYDLTGIYIESESYNRALKTAVISASIAVTLLEDAVKKNNFLYEYAGLSDLIKKASSKPKIADWAESLHLWDILLSFADALNFTNHSAQAEDLYLQLAEHCPSYEIARNAFYKLEKIQSIAQEEEKQNAETRD